MLYPLQEDQLNEVQDRPHSGAERHYHHQRQPLIQVKIVNIRTAGGGEFWRYFQAVLNEFTIDTNHSPCTRPGVIVFSSGPQSCYATRSSYRCDAA